MAPSVGLVAPEQPVHTLAPMKPPPAVPNSLTVSDALQRSAPLTSLWQRMQESNGRFAVVQPNLPAALAAHVRGGPVDAEGWSLLAANAAVAAKLRQLEPRLQEALLAAGWPRLAIRIKVLTA